MKHSEARLPPKTHSVFKTKTTSPGWGRSLFRYRLHLPGNPSLALGQEKKKCFYFQFCISNTNDVSK